MNHSNEVFHCHWVDYLAGFKVIIEGIFVLTNKSNAPIWFYFLILKGSDSEKVAAAQNCTLR